MSHGTLRTDKTCLNCGHIVEEKYCPQCGQQNTEVKQPFYYLFAHFFEDFTHYDSQFWKTIRNLLFSPGTLTKVYLQGKRQQHVPPVKLYIFISFLTFFLISFVGLNNNESSDSHTQKEQISHFDSVNNSELALKKALAEPGLTHEDSVDINIALEMLSKWKNDTITEFREPLRDLGDMKFGNAKSIEEYDAITETKQSFFRKILRPFAEKFFEFKEQKVPLKEILQGFIIVFMHTLPKALFFYLPVFALILWVFHNKKQWWYFDHGVFTLHYFSFLLINVAFFVVLNIVKPLLNSYALFNFITSWLYWIAFVYSIAYFFIAHRRFYGTKKRKSISIGIAVFILNMIAFSIMLFFLAGISLLLIHH